MIQRRHNYDAAQQPSNSTHDLLERALGEINVLVLTDVHSWVASHARHEPHLDADYGHVLSFYERLKDICHAQGKDLWFVMNGDFMHGTGLSEDEPKHLTRILEQMPWDAINVGNHDIEVTETVRYITSSTNMTTKTGTIITPSFVESWGGRYLTSNVILNGDTGDTTMGERYRFLRGERTVLTFGFLYDFDDASPLLTVERVEDVIQSHWFQRVLRGEDGDFDAILVLAHFDVEHPLVNVVLMEIRRVCGKTIPVQFITGHTHYRGFKQMDEFSASFEAGRYLDTIGFVSFPYSNASAVTEQVEKEPNDNHNAVLFQHVFLDANVDFLRKSLNIIQDEFDTDLGEALSQFIEDTQQSMGILNVIGCAPQKFEIENRLNETGSLWQLYMDEIVLNELLQHDTGAMFMQSVDWTFRHDLFQGNITVSDLIAVIPQDFVIYSIAEDIDYSTLKELISIINAEKSGYADDKLPRFGVSAVCEKDQNQHCADDDDVKSYHVYSVDNNVRYLTDQLNYLTNRTFQSHKVLVGNQQYTVKMLWEQYIGNNWSCDKQNSEYYDVATTSSYFSKGVLTTVLISLAALLLMLLLIIKRSRAKKDMYTDRNIIPTDATAEDENLGKETTISSGSGVIV